MSFMEMCYIFFAICAVKNVILNCVEVMWSVLVKCVHLECRLPQLKKIFLISSEKYEHFK